MTYVQTYSGAAFDYEQLLLGKNQPIRLEDLAWSLSGCLRFNCHTRIPWSVAQHCLLVDHIVTALPATHLVALLHDAHEAYTGDLHPTIKKMIYGAGCTLWEELERSIDQQILGWFDKPAGYDLVVKRADLIALEAERIALYKEECERPWSVGITFGASTLQESLDFIDALKPMSREGVADRWMVAVRETWAKVQESYRRKGLPCPTPRIEGLQ